MFGASARIIIIDDEEIIRDSCKQALVKTGYVVKSAEDGDSGLKLFKEFQPDLALVDLKLPGKKSGLEVLEEIERLDPTVVKVVITGYATVSSAVDAMRKGAYNFIPKPFTPEEIRVIVARGIELRNVLLERNACWLEQEKTRKNMMSLVSHELRAPLAATVQYLEVILAGMAGEISPQAMEMIERCDIRLREMLELFNRWLNLAAFDPIKMAEHFQIINLSDIAKESVDILKSLADKKRINLLFDPSTQVPPIRGNRLSLIEIFNNLISNAIKYNQPGGWVQIELHESERMVWTQIRDNGIGIKEEHLPRIFEEFYRVDGRQDAQVKGSGLGLSIVKKMVETHGGMIGVESRFGQGTTFKISFPKGSPKN